MNLLSERGESNKTNANKVSYEASYEAPLSPLTIKTRLYRPKDLLVISRNLVIGQ